MRHILTGFGALILYVNTTLAANTEQDLQQAVELLNAGSPGQAYERLLEKHEADSVNPQEWFLLGIAAKQAGRLADAAAYFERLLALDPEAARARLELAEIAYRLGEGDKARQLLLDVKAANPPPGVVATIDRFIANIAASEQAQKDWRARASLGWLYDSNANAGPDIDSVLLFGLPFILSGNARETADNAWTARLGFDHIKGISDRVNWQSNLSVNWTDYNDLNNLDALYLSFSTGATLRSSERMIWSLPVVADRVKIGHDDSYYSYSYGVAPQWRYLFNDRLSFSLGAAVSKKKYRRNAARHLTALALSPALDYRISERGSLRIGVTGARENSGLAIYSSDSWGVNAAYFHNFSQNFIAIVRAGYSDARYQGREAAFTEKRHDKTARLALDLVYYIAPIKSELSLSISRTLNNSNLPIYQYHRNQVSLSLQRAF